MLAALAAPAMRLVWRIRRKRALLAEAALLLRMVPPDSMPLAWRVEAVRVLAAINRHLTGGA